MEIVAHTSLNCAGRPTTSDAVYYTTPSGAGVFAAGTIDWVCAMQGCQNVDELSSAIVRRVTSNILRAFAKGPAGLDHPAHDNVDELY
jgi:ribosomal protein S5